MATLPSQPIEKRATSRPYLALGLTFLLLGVGFASPFRLVLFPPEHIWQGALSPEILNLYALTAFAGLSHFLYAWRGSWHATQRWDTTKRGLYWGCVFVALLVLLGLRSLLGVAVFSLVAWVYNISHFVKAEMFFTGSTETRAEFYSPVIAFAWFTLCLFQPGPLHNLHTIFVGTVTMAAILLLAGGWRLLASGDVKLPLLTMFLLGETLVWGGYSPYMTMAFRVGIYVFHIAAASFYHYLTAYFYAGSNPPLAQDRWLKPGMIMAINAAIICTGIATGWLSMLRWLRPIFGTEWFTLWVALHLVGSDLFSWMRKMRSQ